MELQYTLNSSVTVPEIIDELDTLWSGLFESDKAMAIIEDSKEEIGTIGKAKRDDVITIVRHGAGLGAASTAIIVGFTPVLAKIIRDLWDYYFLPKIRQKYGDDIVQPK